MEVWQGSPYALRCDSRLRNLLIEALRKCLISIEETMGRFHFLAVEMPRDEAWGKGKDEISCLDSIADVLRRTGTSWSHSKRTVRANHILPREYQWMVEHPGDGQRPGSATIRHLASSEYLSGGRLVTPFRFFWNP